MAGWAVHEGRRSSRDANGLGVACKAPLGGTARSSAGVNWGRLPAPAQCLLVACHICASAGARQLARGPCAQKMETPDALRLTRLDRLIGQLGEHQAAVRQQVGVRLGASLRAGGLERRAVLQLAALSACSLHRAPR